MKTNTTSISFIDLLPDEAFRFRLGGTVFERIGTTERYRMREMPKVEYKIPAMEAVVLREPDYTIGGGGAS